MKCPPSPARGSTVRGTGSVVAATTPKTLTLFDTYRAVPDIFTTLELDEIASQLSATHDWMALGNDYDPTPKPPVDDVKKDDENICLQSPWQVSQEARGRVFTFAAIYRKWQTAGCLQPTGSLARSADQSHKAEDHHKSPPGFRKSESKPC